MEKTLSWNSRVTWLLIVFLFLTILSPMALMAKPAHAQSPRDDAQAALQQVRPQLAELQAELKAETTSTPPEMSVAKPETPKVNEPVVGGELSIYDGTYTGTFYYEYQKNEYDKDGWAVPGEWIPASFDLSITLKGGATDVYGMMSVGIVNVQCSDPVFGTGANGVEPDRMSAVYLLANPPSTPAVRTNNWRELIIITFPNGADIIIPAFAGTGIAGKFLARSDGQAMYSSPDYPDDMWSASASSGPFRVNPPIGQDFYNVKSKSWSLTKVSNQDHVKTTTPPPTTELPTTTTPLTTTTEITEKVVLADISGEVYVRKGGVGEWERYYDSTILRLGDEIRTGENSKVVIKTPDGDQIDLGPMTRLTLVANEYEYELLLGKIRAFIQKMVGKWEVRTPRFAMSIRGTEFTVNVDEDGTTTVTVLEGTVVVRDLTSNVGMTLPRNQMVVLPSIQGGLTQQDMFGGVKVVWPESIDRWWEKDLAATEEQPAPASPGIGIAVIVIVIVAVIVMVLIFALLLRRRHGRKRVPAKKRHL